MLCLFVRKTYISCFPFFGKMDLALHQSLGACSLYVVPKTTACFSFSVGCSDSICYYALCCVEKAPVCLICNGCQGLEEMCFQLPLGRMTDGKTIKHRTAALCVRLYVCKFACYKLLCACLCVNACICVFMWFVLWFFPYSVFIQHCWIGRETATTTYTVTELIKYKK